MKPIRFGSCALCDEKHELTFEHIPPKAVFNSNSILVQNGEQLFESTSYLHGKRSKMNRGFGKYCLCSTCNNFLGANYVEDYIKFVQNCVSTFPKSVKVDDFLFWEFPIKPLTVFKQITAMFMCMNHGLLDKYVHSSLKSFVLDKNSKHFPKQIKIFAYNYIGKPKWSGLQVVNDKGRIRTCSEIDFYPFGFQFTLDSEPVSEYIQDITSFCEFDFNQVVNWEAALQLRSSNLPFVGM